MALTREPVEPPAALLDVQQWLLWMITRPARPRGAGALAQPEEVGLMPGADVQEAAQRLLAGKLSATSRLTVYRRGYFSRLVECLADDYPAVAHVLGAQAFEELCRDFIDESPPRSSSLNFYGASFSPYVAKRREAWAAAVADLARLEWALVKAVHAEAEVVLGEHELAALSPEDWELAELVPSPALQLLELSFPVHACLQAHVRGEPATLPQDRSTQWVAVSRRGLEVHRTELGPRFAQVLQRLIEGRPLLEALQPDEPAQADDGELAQRTTAAFRDWIESGFFSAVRCAPRR